MESRDFHSATAGSRKFSGQAGGYASKQNDKDNTKAIQVKDKDKRQKTKDKDKDEDRAKRQDKDEDKERMADLAPQRTDGNKAKSRSKTFLSYLFFPFFLSVDMGH